MFGLSEKLEGRTLLSSSFGVISTHPVVVEKHGSEVHVTAGSANDKIVVDGKKGISRYVISLGAGDDQLEVKGTVPVIVDGGKGHDQIISGCGQDILYGGPGNDTLNGFDNSDVLYGGPGHDAIYGGKGHDQLCGGSGDDLLRGGRGNDNLFGQAGADWLYGESGNDALLANLPHLPSDQASDYLDGGPGYDRHLSSCAEGDQVNRVEQLITNEFD